MRDTAERARRPTSITVICIIGFLGVPITVALLFSSAAQQVGSWYPPYLGFSAIIGLACTIGLWMMKKWAAYTYIGLVALNQMVLLAMGAWSFSILIIIPVVVIFYVLKHASKMS